MERSRPYGYYVGFHVCLNPEEKIFGKVVSDKEGRFDILCDGRVWGKEGNIEDFKPFVGQFILVPEERAEEILNKVYADYPKEFTCNWAYDTMN